MPKLAINGGSPLIKHSFPSYNTIGREEKEAVARIMDSGNLSQYIGAWHDDFWGGPAVKELEKYAAGMVGAEYALAVNSATSGLYAALGAIGISPGDEVIVPPYTMVASATAALVWGGIPVFADIDPATFCISPKSIKEKITPKTRAIVVVDLFGHPGDYDEIMRIARAHNLLVLEDAAQAPGVTYKGRLCGNLADIGVYSLNYHKHVHCGEGGIVFTNSEVLMKKVALIRNHAEAVVRNMGHADLSNMIGQNYRMSELHAAIAREQYKKLQGLLHTRISYANKLTSHLKEIDGIEPPYVQTGCEHAYYVYPIKYDAKKMKGVHRDTFIAALNAEGLAVSGGYVKPIYLEPMYQKKRAFGTGHWPFELSNVSYEKGICPNCERMNESELMLIGNIHAQLEETDIDLMADVFAKVAENIDELTAMERTA